MPAGAYNFPFRFDIPEDTVLPPSLEKGIGCVRYEIVSKIHRSGLKPCDKKKAPVMIVPNVDVNNPEYDQPATATESDTLACCCCADGPIDVTVEIPRKAWAPGDQFSLRVDIDNKSEKHLYGFSVVLREDYTYYSGYKRSRSKKTSEKIPAASCPVIVPPRSRVSERVDVTVPHAGPTFSLDVGRAIQRLCSFMVVIRVPGIHFDICPEIPVTIGSVPYSGPPPFISSSSMSSSSGVDGGGLESDGPARTKRKSGPSVNMSSASALNDDGDDTKLNLTDEKLTKTKKDRSKKKEKKKKKTGVNDDSEK